MLSPEAWGAVAAVLAMVAGLPLSGWYVRRRERRRVRESERRSAREGQARLEARYEALRNPAGRAQ